MEEVSFDVAVIGAGSSGLAAWRGAAEAGARTLLIEAGPWGTTWVRAGCMPSKLLLAAARAACETRRAPDFGIACGTSSVDGRAVMARLHRALTANAHALKEACRPLVEDMIVLHGAKAIAVQSSYGAGSGREFLDSPKAEWLWEFAVARGLVVHIHPPMNAIASESLMQYRMNEAIGRPFDSTVNAARMISSGVFDRHPELQVLVVHMGGDLPAIMGRLDFSWTLNYHGVADPPRNKVARNRLLPSDYFRRNILVDSMWFNAAGLRAAIEVFGIDRLLLGTDFGPVPYGVREHVDIVCQVTSSIEDRDRILWRNSNAMFRLGLEG